MKVCAKAQIKIRLKESNNVEESAKKITRSWILEVEEF